MSAEQFPLLTAAGLRVLRHKAKNEYGEGDYQDYVLAADIERVLESAPVVYGVPNAFFSHVEGELAQNGKPDTHTARLVNISPINKTNDNQAEIGKRIAEINRLSREIEVLIGHTNVD